MVEHSGQLASQPDQTTRYIHSPEDRARAGQQHPNNKMKLKEFAQGADVNECWLLKFIARKLKLAGGTSITTTQERWKYFESEILIICRNIREFVFQLIKPADLPLPMRFTGRLAGCTLSPLLASTCTQPHLCCTSFNSKQQQSRVRQTDTQRACRGV